MHSIVISFLLLLTGFCFGNPDGFCSPPPDSATGARLHLIEHYTGGVRPVAEAVTSSVPAVEGEEEHPVVDTLPPAVPSPSRSRKPFLVLVGMALLSAVYFLRRKGAGREVPPPELFRTLYSPPLPDLSRRFPEAPEGEPEESWPDLEADEDCADLGEVPAGEVPEEQFSLSRIQCEAAETGEVDVGRLMVLLASVRKPYDYSRVIYWTGRLGVKEALPRILRELAHTNASVRMAAVAALVHLKSDRVEKRMIEMAEERAPHVRKAALLVLSRIGSERCYERVRQSIWDFEPEVREAAAIALGKLQVPDAEFDLRQILNDFEEEVRLRAVWASGQLSEGLQQEGG